MKISLMKLFRRPTKTNSILKKVFSVYSKSEDETDAAETNSLSDTADAEIENLDLPLTKTQTELVTETQTEMVAEIPTEASAEKFVASSDAEISDAENVSETEEQAEQTAAENVEEIKEEITSENISGEFFDFDESDENEILGIKLPDKEKTTQTEKISAPIEETRNGIKISAPIKETEQPISVNEAVKVAPEVVRSDYKKEVSPDEFSSLFENTEVKSRSKISCSDHCVWFYF